MVIVARSQSRNPHISGLPTPQTAVSSGSEYALRRPLRTKLRPSSTSIGSLPTSRGRLNLSTTRCSLGRSRFLNNSPREVFTKEARPSQVTDAQSWWCVNMFCDKHRDHYVYTTCDGWKRHMKEHETIWPCMPCGPFETAETGLVCVLCGSMNPDETHMAGHSIGDCGDTSTKLRSVSRRANLERHLLRSHAVSGGYAREVASRWEITLRKKYFACGFCVYIFSTIHEQLNHIDMEHFRKGQHITEWSASKVIRGLLLSPKVASSFQGILSSDTYAIDRDLQWDRHMVEDLQRRLEVAEEPAEVLAMEAYGMLTFNLSRQDCGVQHRPMSISGLAFVDQGEVAIDSFAVPAGSSEKDIEHQFEELTPGSDQPWALEDCHVTAHSTSCSTSAFESPTSQSGTSEAQSDIGYQSAQPVAPRGIPTVSASSALWSQPVDLPAQSGSASSTHDLNPTTTYSSPIASTHWKTAPSATHSHSTGAAYNFREQPSIYQAPTHNTEVTGMPSPKLDGLVQSSGLERCSFPLDTCDPRDLIKTSR